MTETGRSQLDPLSNFALPQDLQAGLRAAILERAAAKGHPLNLATPAGRQALELAYRHALAAAAARKHRQFILAFEEQAKAEKPAEFVALSRERGRRVRMDPDLLETVEEAARFWGEDVNKAKLRVVREALEAQIERIKAEAAAPRQTATAMRLR
jgi:hypothetical protein